MFDFNTDYENVKARCEDLRREFEQRAQIAPAVHEQPPFYAGALVSVGKLLVEVGSRLQVQYSYNDDQDARQTLDTGAATS